MWTGSIDLVEVLFTLFWLFFIGLVLYLHRESKREGYPLESDRTHRAPGTKVQGFPGVPEPKTFALPHGGTVTVPRKEPDNVELKAEPAAPYPGAPLVPTGNPMLDGVGPAAWSDRSDTPDLTLHGENRIVPMRVAPEFVVASRDPDPRGMEVIAGDGKVAGTVSDIWVDVSEPTVMFLEVDLGSGGRNVMLPMGFAKVSKSRNQVNVQSIYAAQFADVPALASPDQITLLEEDKIYGYFAGGKLYADPARQEPLI